MDEEREVAERYYLDKLKDPFPIEKVKYRQGPGGKQLAYIDARDVADRLDEVVGQAFWQNRYTCVNGVTVCEIGLKVDGEWAWKADGAPETTIEAEKGALSDAFKRAGVKWGIARYLYAPPPPQEQPQQEQPPIQQEPPAWVTDHSIGQHISTVVTEGGGQGHAPPSEKQMNFLRKLLSSKSEAERDKFMQGLGPNPSKQDVSKAIDQLKQAGG